MTLSKKEELFLHLKNSFGWSTKRKIIVFSVDDYGNIRIASKKAREVLIKAGINLDANRFDRLDALDTREDLEQLFETLHSVKDKNQRAAVFTPYALPANINFSKVESSGFENYYYELLPETLHRLPGYERTWDLWRQGIDEKIFVPQFHGREHVNLKWFSHFIQEKDSRVITSIKENCWAGLDFSPFKDIDYVSSFAFTEFKENQQLIELAKNGLQIFEEVFGYKASQFNAPGRPAHSILEDALVNNGIKYLDSASVKYEHQGNGRYRKKIRLQGGANNSGQIYHVRNCVFEPSIGNNAECVNKTLKQIEIAFKHNKPAVISSHRVNFCGHIDPENRRNGLTELRRLLKSIVIKWPEVEFMSASELGDTMIEK